ARPFEPRHGRWARRAPRADTGCSAPQPGLLQRDCGAAAPSRRGGRRCARRERGSRRHPGQPSLSEPGRVGRGAAGASHRDGDAHAPGPLRTRAEGRTVVSDWSRAVGARPVEDHATTVGTVTGNRGLQIEEKLIFEQDSPGRCGVDLVDPPPFRTRLGGLERQGRIGLPGLSEPQIVRHFTRLSQKNYAIDSGVYPLGSCTMKHNPRLNEKLARLPGLADIHPLQPVSTVPGALALIDTLAHWLKTLTGMPAIALSPGAGAHGELCGMMSIRAALEARGERRSRVLVPESAHGTNPATAAACGYAVDSVSSNPRGRVDIGALRTKLDTDVAALMLTNPNTCGLFEDEILEIAAAVHAVGAFFYCDGATFNAIVGRVRPADLGIDCMHLNLHKTFSTPHGGGGPGSGPVALAASLAPYAPLPWQARGPDGPGLVEHKEGEAQQSIGRLKVFHGPVGI